MSKVENKIPQKMETKGTGDHKRETGGVRNDRSDKSHSRSDSRESRDRNRLDRLKDEKDSKDNKEKDQKDSREKDAQHDEKSGDLKSTEEKKFTGRCRLFVGNLTPDVSEDEFKKMFLPYGEVSEVYVNTSRGFGFIRLDFRQNAEAAKAALDGMQRKGRVLRVRFATHGAALRVKNLHPYVSNELLEQAFNQFGELERAIVIVDDRGKATGEGLVEFVRKPGAQQALRRINEGVYLFGSDPKPIEVEPLEHKDEEDGMPEKFLNKNDQYKKEREKEPRFAAPGSFEYEFGMRWKQIDEMEKKRIENVKKEMEEARIKLEDEMQNALYEFQAEQIRQDLLRQQEELRRLEQLRDQDRMRRQQELEMRMSRRAEEERQRQQEERRRQEIIMRQQEMQQRRSGGRDDLMAGMRGGDMSGGLRGEMAGGMRAGDMAGGHRGGDMQGGMRGDLPIGMRGGDMAVGMRGGDMPGGMRGGDMPGSMRGGDIQGGMRGDMPGGMRSDMAGGMRGGDMRGEGQAFGPQGIRGGQGRPEPQPLMGTQARAGAPPMQPPPAPPAGIGLERGQQGMGRGQGGAPNGEGSPNINNIPSLVAQSGTPMRQSRFDQSQNQFEQGFGPRGGMGGGPGGNQAGAGGMGGGPAGMGGNSPGMAGGPAAQQAAALFQQMQGIGHPSPEQQRAMMERRREATQSGRDEIDMKRMRRF